MGKFLERESHVLQGCRLRLRQRPSIESETLDLIPGGSKIKLIGQYREWFKVSYNNKEGYCLKQYIAIIEE